MKKSELATQVGLVLLAVVSGCYIISAIVLLINWPVDSDKTMWYMMKNYFIPGTLLFCLISAVFGIILLVLSKIVYLYFIKDKTSNFPKRFSIISAVLLVVAVTVFSLGFWVSDRYQVTSIVLKAGNFAELPRSVRNINYAKHSSLLSTTSYLSFEAHSVDIEKWILESPQLKRNTPALINLHNRPNYEHKALEGEIRWFVPENIKSGRIFELRSGKVTSILVFTDDQNGVVYIRVSNF